MLILAIDTSGRHGSVALCRGDGTSFEVLRMTPLEGGTYSARLIPTIDELLKASGLSLANLDGFAVVSGPGSFTGLRVGLATVKGMCEILNKPLVTVSMLEALAMTYGSAGKEITAILDAGRSEVYVGDYEIAGDRATPVRECIVKLSDFATPRECITPHAAVANHLGETGIAVQIVAPVQADGIGRIGIRKLLAGDVTNHATVDVNYIRRSDAEIFSPPKR